MNRRPEAYLIFFFNEAEVAAVYFYFFNLFLAVLWLYCCPQAFFSWGKWGSPSCGARSPHCSGVSGCRAGTLGTLAQQLRCTGLVALRPVGSCWTRDRTHAPCIGRQILNHLTIWEAPNKLLKPIL